MGHCIPASVSSLPVFLRLMVLRRVLLLNDGRDKVLKTVQYGAKALLFLTLLQRLAARIPASSSLHSKINEIPGRLEKLISHLSMARKIIRLAHFLEPISNLTEPAPDTSTFINNIIGVLNDVSDDTIALSKMGVLEKSWTTRCTPISDRLWLASIILDARELGMEMMATFIKRKRALRDDTNHKDEKSDEKLKQLEKKWKMQLVSATKLTADGVFCLYDVFGCGDRGWSDGWQTFSGLTAALCGTYKLYVKCK